MTLMVVDGNGVDPSGRLSESALEIPVSGGGRVVGGERSVALCLSKERARFPKSCVNFVDWTTSFG